jgi:hypothetical protein
VNLNKIEETTYRSAKERKNMEKYKRVRVYLKKTMNQKEDRLNEETVCGSSPDSSPSSSRRKRSQSLHLKVNQEAYCLSKTGRTYSGTITMLPTSPNPCAGTEQGGIFP